MNLVGKWNREQEAVLNKSKKAALILLQFNFSTYQNSRFFIMRSQTMNYKA